MAVTFNESAVEAQAFGSSARRQRLLTEARVAGTHVLLDRWTLVAGAAIELAVAGRDLAWFQLLEGEAILSSAAGSQPLTADHVAFLPPGFRGTLAAHNDATALYAGVPDASRFDPQIAARALPLRIVDWTHEPVLASEHDARSRIYLVTPKLFGTRAVRGEMILYPPGTEASNHHHEGAEHFMYVVTGSGTAWANERPFHVRKGDLIWYADRERHYLRSDPAEEMRFVEYFIPGECTTVWAAGASVCTWRPTGKDIRGRAPSRQIAGHSSRDFAIPGDV
jgi:quercetin dioxygenase-like cupin family protein